MRLFQLLIKPAPLPYDYAEWEQLPFPERAKKVCQAWATQGFGAPPLAPLFYLLKIIFYSWIWLVFCSYSTDLGGFASISEWWFKLEALGKFIFWTCLMEVIGWGGASGPLCGRYMPPFGASTYFLRPNTIKLPLFPNLPIIGKDNRNILDVLLYVGLVISLLRVCLAPSITPDVVLPVAILLPLLGILDRQIYLAARADMWYPAIFVFLFPTDTGSALQILWIAIWLWAAFAKLQPSFSSVISVMICNSPFLKFKWLTTRLFRNYPNDLRLSKATTYIAHFGTLVEFTLPFLLLVGTLMHFPTDWLFYPLLGLTAFHLFIFFNIPMGVPMEWNVIMVFGGWVLFYAHPEFVPTQIKEPWIVVLYGALLFIVPLIGHLFPKYVSFLLSMRYYAGTWAYTLWLFKKGKKLEKLDPNITKTSPDLRQQLAFFYDEQTTSATLSKVIAFRLMHLPGRALSELLPKAVDNIDDYYWQDGEFIAGEVGGWNFGDGHLSSETMLAAVQKRCGFESGELRVIMVESPALHTGNLHWRIHDAKDGLMEEGSANVYELKEKMLWINSI